MVSSLKLGLAIGMSWRLLTSRVNSGEKFLRTVWPIVVASRLLLLPGVLGVVRLVRIVVLSLLVSVEKIIW